MDDQGDFYELLIARLETRKWDSVDIYSISACLGFYSKGMIIFSRVLSSMKNALINPPPFKTENMRLLILPDDNPIDNFAVKRYNDYLVPYNLQMRRFQAPSNNDGWLQFAIFEGQNYKEVIFTEPQKGERDEALNIGINKLKPAISLSEEKDFNRYKKLFQETWDNSEIFDYPRIPTIDELKVAINERFPFEPTKEIKEKALEDALYHFLHGYCEPNTPIHRQFKIGNDIIDLVIGEPGEDQIAIELKIAPNKENDLKRLDGQIESYRKVIKNILIIIVTNGMSNEKVKSLRTKIRKYKDTKEIEFVCTQLKI